jgi:hypothetical protein
VPRSEYQGFELRPLALEDAAVQERLNAFYDRLGLVKPNRSPLQKWVGFFRHGVCALVVCVVVRPDESIELTDYYPAPTRDGVKAGYAGMALLRALVEKKIIPYWIGGIVANNAFGLRHVERFFGIKPRSMVYVYDGSGR